MIRPLFDERDFVTVDVELDKERFAPYFSIAEKARKEGDFKKAALAYEYCTEIAMICSELYFISCKAHIEAGMFRKAKKHLDAALRLNPGIVDRYDQIAECYLNVCCTNAAINYFSKFLEVKPGAQDDYFNLGERCSNIGKYKNAVTFYAKSIQMGREDAEIYFCRGYAYLMRNRFKLALADLDKVLEINPNYPKVHFEKGLCFFRLKKFDNAIIEFTKAIDCNEMSGEAYFWRASCSFNLKKFNETIADCTVALNHLSRDEYDSRIFRHRGYSLFELGEWGKCIADLDSAICLGPKEHKYSPSDFEMRGLAYEKLGNKERAEGDYQTARLMKEPWNYFNKPYFDYEKKTLIFKNVPDVIN